MWCRRFRVIDRVVRVEVPDGLRPVARALYADATAETGNDTRRDELCLRVEETAVDSYRLVVEGGAAGTALGVGALYELLQRELSWSLLEALKSTHLLLHAGAVVVEGRGLLLPGDHDSGKSSLSLALGRRGGFLADDISVLDPASACLQPFPRELVLHAGTRSEHPGLGEPAPYTDFDGYGYWPATRAGLVWGTPTGPAALVFPRRQDGVPPRLTPVPPAEATRRLLEQSFDLETQALPGIERLTQLGSLPAVEATFDRAGQVVPMIVRWLGSAVVSGDGGQVEA